MTTFDPNLIEWQSPPEKGAPKADYSAFVEALRAHPGEWAIVRRDAETGKVQDLRNVAGVRVTSTPNKDGTSTVYARWVGVDEFGNTILTPEEIERRDARARRRAQKEADAAAAKEAESAPF